SKPYFKGLFVFFSPFSFYIYYIHHPHSHLCMSLISFLFLIFPSSPPPLLPSPTTMDHSFCYVSSGSGKSLFYGGVVSWLVRCTSASKTCVNRLSFSTCSRRPRKKFRNVS